MEFEIEVEAREDAGRAGSRRLRKTGKVPGIVYGAGQAPTAIAIEHDGLMHQMANEAFFTSILTMKLGKESQPVIIKDVQRHPSRSDVLHLDLQRIVADEEITLHVPIHYLHEDEAIGVRQQGGVIDRLMTDVEVSCLPKDLPSHLEVDVSQVELNGIVHLSDIPVAEGVTLVALEHGADQPIFTIAPPRREEVEEAVEAEAPEAPEAPERVGEAKEPESED